MVKQLAGDINIYREAVTPEDISLQTAIKMKQEWSSTWSLALNDAYEN